MWLGALLVATALTPTRSNVDDPALTHDLGRITDVWARWDSVWFLRIAAHGYGAASSGAASFYPLYPAAVGALGRLLGEHYVLAGVLISLAATWASFELFYRIAKERLGAEGGRRAVLYLAIFPTTIFLSAVYSEALFLLLSLSAFYFAERRRWLRAWLAAGLAILTRAVGFALLPALVLIAWRVPERRRALTGVAISLGLFVVYPLLLWQQTGDAFAFTHGEARWHRHLSPAGPLAGIWNGLRAGWAGIEQFASRSQSHRYWPEVTDSSPFHVAFFSLETLMYLILFVVLATVVWRRFGASYGIYSALSLAIPLSAPSRQWPLLSMPRFGLVVFPLFIALASVGASRHRHLAIVVASIILLGFSVVRFSLWRFVA
jgi:4-amino-4-deoxy-L-arabinose transferase-like glycosyltransferase